MGLEIERRFLVRTHAWRDIAGAGTAFKQGYLCTTKERTVRIRLAGERAWITIKGRSRGAVRPEFEYAIPSPDASELLGLCGSTVIDKTRYRVRYADHVWDVDEFAGANAPLVLAEVELAAEDEAVEIPGWVGDEVTGEARYQNSQLSRRPFSSW